MAGAAEKEDPVEQLGGRAVGSRRRPRARLREERGPLAGVEAERGELLVGGEKSVTAVVEAASAVGRISADTVAAYPPGIPNLLPGEVITTEVVEFLTQTAAAPFGHVRGAISKDMSLFRVVEVA